jgi:alkanesulfonate monooxygenase SsuD/methylene tetrahydromethanopterin reductase-like flavin-dependent oxidoreductase (luciferase family)
MTRTRPLRLGYFTYHQGSRPAAEIYAEVIELFERAEAVGFDSAWVAQHHFGHHGGLPSPFVFFAAVAARTRRIRLGTAIIALPLEEPIRVAEDAAVFETLFPGRLELGLGTGFASVAVLETFGHAGEDRRALYDAGFPRLAQALRGEVVNADGDVLHPPGTVLAGRIWESPASLERTAEIARRGSGLLLSRIAIGGGDRPSHEIQIPLVETYLANLPVGVEPRIGFSRTVYPTRNPKQALADLTQGLEETAAAQARAGAPPSGIAPEDRFRHNNIHFGEPERVIESLLAEPLIDEITDLICQVQPGLPSQEQTLEAIELLATEVAPALGWRPETGVRSPEHRLAAV